MTPRRPRRWLNSQQFLQELYLRRIEREERRKAERRKVDLHLKLGIASPDELAWRFPSGIGRID